MQDTPMQAQTQPFFKLAQANVELIQRFSTSPEMTTQAKSFVQQATESSQGLIQSGAFSQMMEGMMKNYRDFFMELNQNTLALMGQGQAALARQVQQVSEAVSESSNDAAEATDGRTRRSRQAA